MPTYEEVEKLIETQGYWDELRSGGKVILRHLKCGFSIPLLNEEVFGKDAKVEFTPRGRVDPRSVPYAAHGWKCGYCGSFYSNGRVPKCSSCGAPREKDY